MGIVSTFETPRLARSCLKVITRTDESSRSASKESRVAWYTCHREGNRRLDTQPRLATQWSLLAPVILPEAFRKSLPGTNSKKHPHSGRQTTTTASSGAHANECSDATFLGLRKRKDEQCIVSKANTYAQRSYPPPGGIPRSQSYGVADHLPSSFAHQRELASSRSQHALISAFVRQARQLTQHWPLPALAGEPCLGAPAESPRLCCMDWVSHRTCERTRPARERSV